MTQDTKRFFAYGQNDRRGKQSQNEREKAAARITREKNGVTIPSGKVSQNDGK